ncbi:MAG: flagellar hook assembly protein FlgD [Proteobacteria bacterium]|nr:flagellar hook assembly protein FlgD [Pseudomonadota bacterium]
MILGSASSTDGLALDSQSVGSKEQLNEDLNRFLKLLITQLQNQDPLEPMSATEFTSQLVQFAGVEQQINANANLEKLLKLQQTSQISSMVGFIGNAVEARGNTVYLEDGLAESTYTLDVNADDITITVRNAAGLTVFTVDGEPGIGSHDFLWDGKDKNGILQPDGAYIIIVSALDREDNLLDVSQTVSGRIIGAGAEDGVVSLFMGDVVILMDDVISVKEPSA